MQELPTPRRRRAAHPRLIAFALALSVACAHAPAAGASDAIRALWLPTVGAVPLEATDLTGHVVLVDFFATWCFPCLAELPNLEDFHRRLGPRGLTIVAVGLDLEGPTVLQPFAEKYALPFPVLLGNDAIRSGQTVFGPIEMLPTTVLIGRNGQILGAFGGVADHDRLSGILEKAL